MKRSPRLLFSLLPCLMVMAAPLAAQTTIGGGICSSISLNGTYMMTLTGRQVTAAGSFTSIYQADGAVTFDGQSKVTMTLTANTLKATASILTYSGTYTVQANCAGSVTIATGDTASFNLLVYNQGTDFLLAGSDASYNFTGGGSLAPVNACTMAKLAGVYSLNATGYVVSSAVVAGISDGVGLIQFDGKGAATINFFVSSGSSATATIAAAGTYSLGSNCLGTASFTDSKGNAYALAIAATGVSGVAITAFDITLGQSGKLTLLGAGHPLYGQPTALLTVPAAWKPREAVAQGERA